MNTCTKCDSINIIGVQYGYGEPEHYDGISEWRCGDCGCRQGRFSGRVLNDGECELRSAINYQKVEAPHE